MSLGTKPDEPGAPCTTSPPTVAEPSAGGSPTGSIVAWGELIIVSGAPCAFKMLPVPEARTAPPLSLVRIDLEALAAAVPVAAAVVVVPAGLVGVLPEVTTPVAMFSQVS